MKLKSAQAPEASPLAAAVQALATEWDKFTIHQKLVALEFAAPDGEGTYEARLTPAQTETLREVLEFAAGLMFYVEEAQELVEEGLKNPATALHTLGTLKALYDEEAD